MHAIMQISRCAEKEDNADVCGIAPDVGMFDKNDADANLCLLLFENNDIDDDVLDTNGSFVEKIFLLVNMLLIHNNELQ